MEQSTIYESTNKEIVRKEYDMYFEELVYGEHKYNTPVEVYKFDITNGYVGGDGVWYNGAQSPSCYADVYQVVANQPYKMSLGTTVGTRFRCTFLTSDPSVSTGNISGIRIVANDNPTPNVSATYTPAQNGYIVIGKDNAGHSGIPTYMVEKNF